MQDPSPTDEDMANKWNEGGDSKAWAGADSPSWNPGAVNSNVTSSSPAANNNDSLNINVQEANNTNADQNNTSSKGTTGNT